MRIKQLIMISLIFNTLPATAMLNRLTAQGIKKINMSAKLRSLQNHYCTETKFTPDEKVLPPGAKAVLAALSIPAGFVGGAVGPLIGVPVCAAITYVPFQLTDDSRGRVDYGKRDSEWQDFYESVGITLGRTAGGAAAAYTVGGIPGVAACTLSVVAMYQYGQYKKRNKTDL